MRLRDWAKKQGVCYQTAWIHFKAGKIYGAYRLPTGTIIVPDISVTPEHVVVYARVSSSENRSNLDSQAERVAAFCSARGWVVNEIVKECASGLNDQRPKLTRVLEKGLATKLVVEHKDRLTRFGFNYIKTLMKGCNIVVINEAVDSDADLMQDFVSLVTSFCARIYGRRRSQRSTERILQQLSE